MSHHVHMLLIADGLGTGPTQESIPVHAVDPVAAASHNIDHLHHPRC
jgi:hypothetical protein